MCCRKLTNFSNSTMQSSWKAYSNSPGWKLWTFKRPKCSLLPPQQPIYEAGPLNVSLPPHSFSSLSDDRSKASSKMVPPHSAIHSFLFQMTHLCTRYSEKILYATLISLMCTTCPTHLILIDLCTFANNTGLSPSLCCYILLSYSQIFSSAPLPSLNYFLSTRCDTNSCIGKIS
jgi:hypothetical protein